MLSALYEKNRIFGVKILTSYVTTFFTVLTFWLMQHLQKTDATDLTDESMRCSDASEHEHYLQMLHARYGKSCDI